MFAIADHIHAETTNPLSAQRQLRKGRGGDERERTMENPYHDALGTHVGGKTQYIRIVACLLIRLTMKLWYNWPKKGEKGRGKKGRGEAISNLFMLMDEGG